jgi:hypothetical protein
MRSIWEFVNTHPHQYKPSSDTFLQLDLDKTSRILKLVENGKERGQKELPETDSKDFDQVERSILAEIQAQVKIARDLLNQHLSTFAERLSGLDLEGHAVQIKADARGALADFTPEISRGRDRLHGRRKDVLEAQRDYELFREAHRLNRGAHVPDSKLYLVALIIALLLAEAIMNGLMLGRGHELGIVGGIGNALIIAVWNILVLGLLGSVALRWVHHRNGWIKVVSGLGLISAFSLAVVSNIIVAHYRDALGGALSDSPEQIALERFLVSPFGVADAQSWLLFMLGVAFVVGGIVDLYKMNDPYPGFGARDRRRRDREHDYAHDKEQLLDDLTHVRDDWVDLMTEARNKLARHRGDYGAIIENRRQTVIKYRTHLEYLEQAANQLLATYRETNRRSRKTKAPKHFDDMWSVKTLDAGDTTIPSAIGADDMRKIVDETMTELSDAIERVQGTYEDAVKQYDRIEQLEERELERVASAD